MQKKDEKMLEILQKETFDFFLKEINPRNGLIPDKNKPDWPSSIAVMGMALSVYIVEVERGLLSRAEAVHRTLTALRFFNSGHQGTEADAMGYKGFYYHFLNMKTGKRAWKSELSTIDTAIFIMGALSAAAYFKKNNKQELEIRELADGLYRRVDWVWALNGKKTICFGWKPERGFLRRHWDNGYSEAHILYFLALGSPTFPIPKVSYKKWISTFEWVKVYDIEYIYAGPLFIHQLSQIWIDFRGIHDSFNKKTGFDYFENSRRATVIQQKYAIQNPKKFTGYSQNNWGFTASDGPGPAILKIDGKRRKFYDYTGRGVPYGPDDGTISPWGVVASLPFAPDIVLGTLNHAIERLPAKQIQKSGFDASFNLTYPGEKKGSHGWVSPWKFGLNQGPTILMIENFRSGLIWKTMKKCPYIIQGLRKAGFSGGWLDSV